MASLYGHERTANEHCETNEQAAHERSTHEREPKAHEREDRYMGTLDL